MLSRVVHLSTSPSSIIFHKAYVHECSAEQAASTTSYHKVAGVIVRARWGERRCSPSLFRGSDRTMRERPVSRFGPPAVPPFLFRSFLGTSAPWSVGFCQQSAFLARRFRSAVGIRRLHSMVSSPAFHIVFSRQGVHDHPTSSVVRPAGLPVRLTQFLLIRRTGAWPAG